MRVCVRFVSAYARADDIDMERYMCEEYHIRESRGLCYCNRVNDVPYLEITMVDDLLIVWVVLCSLNITMEGG